MDHLPHQRRVDVSHLSLVLAPVKSFNLLHDCDENPTITDRALPERAVVGALPRFYSCMPTEDRSRPPFLAAYNERQGVEHVPSQVRHRDGRPCRPHRILCKCERNPIPPASTDLPPAGATNPTTADSREA